MTEKSTTFESLLDREFHWPQQGDRLFAGSDGWWQTASVGGNSFVRAAIIEHGYKRAGDILVERALAERSDMDFLVYPIIFCYRHFLEMSIKWVLNNYGRYAHVSANTTSHKLEELWPDCRKVFKHFDPNDEDNTLDVIAECIVEFAKIDPDSAHFRYPTDRDGNEISLKVSKVGLQQLRRTMDAIENFFVGADGFMSACL